MTRHRIWREAFADALRVEWAQVEALPALRCTVGVAVPLVVALALHQAAAGVFIAVGGVSTGFGSFQGAYRSRAATMLLCAAGMAGSLFIGSLAGASTLAAVVVAALWGFGAGLSVALGPAASFVALQSAVAALVAGAYPADLRGAAVRALLVFAGGLAQIVLVVGLWPLRSFQAERTAIARLYRSLAAYAAGLPRSAPTPPEPHTFAAIGAVRRDPQPFARSHDVLLFRGLIDEAERIRASLAALSLSPGRSDQTLAGALAAVLAAVADGVDEGRAPRSLPAEWTTLETSATALRGRARIDALLGQIRAACRMAALPAAAERTTAAPARGIRAIPPLRDAFVTIRANLSLRSTACRHALRLAPALALATAIYRLLAIPRGYWLSMTALLVLKPEYRETFVRGTARIIGTLAGAALATLLVRLLGTHPAVLTALLVAFVWSGYAIFRASYAAFTISITGYIVLLLFLSGVPGPIAATYRALDTVLGGALALAIYRMWPTWESSNVGEVLAVLAAALARDADIVLGTYVEPARWERDELRQSIVAARLARSNAEASVARSLGEPARDRFDPERAIGILAAFRRYALGALALHAGLDSRPRPTPELAPLHDQLVAGLDAVARALHHGTRPAPLPPLRDTLVDAQRTIDPALVEPLDVLVDVVNSAGALLAAGAL